MTEPPIFEMSALETYKDALVGCLIESSARMVTVDADETRSLVVVSTLAEPPGLAACARRKNIPDAAWLWVEEPGGGFTG